jgi:prepilin-type N-terminal cleavage/methylation domain-containing protein
MRKKARGFSLVELMVVVAVIAILVGLLMPAILRAQERARENKARSEIYALQTAWASYCQHYREKDGPSFKPPNYTDMTAAATKELGGGNKDGIAFMEFTPKQFKTGFLDPWKQPYHLEFKAGQDVITKWSFETRVQCKNAVRGRY